MESYNNEPQISQAASYEFNTTEEKLIGDLAGKMKFVSYFFMAVGVVQAFAGILHLTSATLDPPSIIISGLINLAIGIWTYKAASSFSLVAKTRGHDLENLMDALKQLKKLYSLQYWLLIVALVIFGLFALINLFSQN
ncbi:hypothetical protein [Gloeothece verrucosa]|uniref:Uncharacterized protein n=1 Tax=Gloeothece verrucosa (strain PCC 7822) TaxID=497965 RepID=E0UH44_GLOV7|nr:hypothetical protein [Gloeothece verrucosa]ADN15643.1 hypothetical protein Cyan7822_3706 [Gloeothece verrucosa PCC 7822]